jgi:hypothetical protein
MTNKSKQKFKTKSKLTELEKEQIRQIELENNWNNYFHSNGLYSFENFLRLPQFKCRITNDMIEYDKAQPKSQRWKLGDRYPFTGEAVTPKVIEVQEGTVIIEKDSEKTETL